MNVARKTRSNGYAVIFLASMILTLIPLTGLAIDCSILYIVKARLSAACDAAALAAARNLNLGQTMAEQEREARARALSFYNANFSERYLSATRSAPLIDIPTNTPNNVLTISVSGTARVKTYFIGMLPRLNLDTVSVAATGAASRRDVNMMLVLDRSSSLITSGQCQAMKDSATAFVNNFVDGRDTIGLITFGTNYVVAFPPARDFKSAGTNIARRISQITCGENTAMSAAYWKAYQELVGRNMPNALNTIVLFTDGIPNGIYADFPVRATADNRHGFSGGPCANNRTCNVPASDCADRGTPLRGVLAQWGDNQPTGPVAGLFEPQGTSVTSHGATRIGRAGCAFQGNAERVGKDVAYVPDVDYQGNRAKGNSNQYIQYQAQDFVPGSGNTQIRMDRPLTIGRASSNLMDHAAQRVRARALNANIGVVTFVIGLGLYSLPVQQQPDDVLLRRVANDPGNAQRGEPASPIYARDPYLPDGKYIRAENSAEMANAFQRIASEVLRLSR